MLTTHIARDPSAALEYYQQGLSLDDYYRSGKVKAFFQGELAQRLGLKGTVVTDKMFASLLHNIDPVTGEKLRVRDRENARCGYDFCISVPKSVSVAYTFKKDKVIMEAIHSANKQMMKAVEAYAQIQENGERRVYKYSKEMLFSSYLHSTTRPSEYMLGDELVLAPDMNYHIHNFIHSVSWNEEKQRFQALELGDGVYRRLPYFEKLFHAHLAFELQRAGYQIERRENGFFELAGISRSVVDRFSNRTKSIEKFAVEKGISDPKVKGELGAKLRLSKGDATVPEDQLVDHWASRLTSQELKTIRGLKRKIFIEPRTLSVTECVDRAISHHLEREAAAPKERVLATAMTYGYGPYLPDEYRRELEARDNILEHEIQGMSYITSMELYQAENKLIGLAASGKGMHPALNPHYQPVPGHLNTQQICAVQAILNSTDRTLILRGSAGVGKSYLLKSVADGVVMAGKSLFAVTPSTQAAKVLSDEGFEATTVAALLHNPKLQEQLRNQVLLLDEAGLCGLKDMSEVLSLSKKLGFRCVLSGDTRQHAPVQHEALSILEKQAQVQTVTVNKIMRQKPEAYRAAIQKLAVGRTLEGFNDLDKKLGAIKEEGDHEKRLNQISDDYIASIARGRSALIVSPTNHEGSLINEMVRSKLKALGKLSGKERNFERLVNLSYTESQKRDLINYSKGMVVRFSKNQKGGLYAGSHWEILPVKNGKDISIRELKTGRTAKLPFEQVKHMEVFRKTTSSLASGDLIRLTQNVKTEGKKLNNGNTYQVEGFTRNGIRLNNGKVIPDDTYHWKHGYTETSHSSQGKTKDDVLISMSDLSFAAVSEKTLYVSASRGKYSATIYTSSRDDLRRAVARSGTRVTAREVAQGHEQRLLKQKQQAHHRAMNEKIKEHGRIHRKEKTVARSISQKPARH